MKFFLRFFYGLPFLFIGCQSDKNPKLELTSTSYNQKMIYDVLKLNTVTDAVQYFGITNCIIDTFPKKDWCKNYQDVYIFKHQRDEAHLRFVNGLLSEIRIGLDDNDWVFPETVPMEVKIDTLVIFSDTVAKRYLSLKKN